MASVTARLSIFGESSYVSQEKDASTVLTELDKGLRSNKAGEQSEAIVKFPRLFEKYPFPILVNSAMLKLADVFRVGNNFLKLCILRVVEQSQKHLEKILNVDEFLRRVFQVIHSNDPVARAITLRLLGTAACIIAERKNVHHSIMNSLDSHDGTELQAAIFAASKFTKQSGTFAMSICTKLAELIGGLETPVEMKLKLIPIFQHMHHDSSTAVKARQLCTSLLQDYPAQNFVLITLEALSKLSAKCLLDIPTQCELLLQLLKDDPRKQVKLRALHDLAMLARIGPHVWTQDYIQAVCNHILETPFASLKHLGLEVLTVLLDTVAVEKFNLDKGSKTEQLLTEICFHTNPRLSAKACMVGANISSHILNGSGDTDSVLVEMTVLGLEGLIMATAGDTPTPQEHQALKCGLLSVVKLCYACTELTDRFVDTMSSTLTGLKGASTVMLCECLSAVSSYQNDLLRNLVPDLSDIIRQHRDTDFPSRNKLMRSLLTLLFQATVEEPLSGEDLRFVIDTVSTLDGWSAYQVARQASRYGHHGLAAKLYAQLSTKVSTEHNYFWMTALRDCSQAESHLQETTHNITEHCRKVAAAQTNLHKAIANLRAASTTQHPLHFQSQYLHLRTRMLLVISQLVKACSSFQLSPPPAIAKTLAMTTGEELHACGHVVASLQKCGRQLEELGKQYGDLYQSSFDADPTSLTNIQILQQCFQVLIYMLDAILSGKVNKPEELQKDWVSPKAAVIEHQRWYNAWQDALSLLQQCRTNPGDPSLTYQHMACIKQAAMILMNTPLSIPRYFFQKLQSTDIKLVISPQPKGNEPINVHYDTHLTLKVEGVMQHSRPGLFRKVDQVTVSVRSEQHSRGPTSQEVKFVENPTNDMSQSARPHNDYFSMQFLLAFPVTGVHVVAVDVALVDAEGVVWNSGPRTSISVKSYDEAVQRQQQQQYATQRQQMRTAGQINVVSS